MNSLLEALIAAKLSGSGSGGSVTPASIVTATGQMTEEQKAATRANIGAVSLDEIGTVFTLKGGVATVEDLPASGNSVGDVYYVESVSAGYIWLTSASQPNGYWEELGETFDVTVDSELSATSENPVQNKVINAALAAKGTYSKPSGGIPKTDLASDVQTSLGKADTALQQHQSLAGYATETYVQRQIAAIPDELPAVSASDNGKFLRVVSGAWAAQAVPSAESNSFGGGS